MTQSQNGTWEQKIIKNEPFYAKKLNTKSRGANINNKIYNSRRKPLQHGSRADQTAKRRPGPKSAPNEPSYIQQLNSKSLFFFCREHDVFSRCNLNMYHSQNVNPRFGCLSLTNQCVLSRTQCVFAMYFKNVLFPKPKP